MLWTHVLFTLATGALVSAYRHPDHCQYQRAQNQLDLDEMMGLWYGIEVFYHRERQYSTEPRHQDAVCPQIILSRDTEREISLTWQESSKYMEFYFKITRPTAPGAWLAVPGGHPPFEGHVRVIKAVSSHMVLTFCSLNNHYSVLMSREKHLSYADIESVEGMMDRFNLTIFGKSKQCRSGAAIFTGSLYYIMAVIGICLYRS